MFSLSDIETLFARLGDRAYAGEPVTQLEHALQSGLLAEEAGASEALVTAAFLHDLGHLINDQGTEENQYTPTLRGIDDRHEYVAIPRLRALFGEDVLTPIRLHVDAKRYLCARGDRAYGGQMTGPQYLDALSADSKRSLQLQGGVFSDAEADAFIATPHAADALRVRLWDDAAKIAGRPTPGIAHYLAIAERVHRAASASPSASNRAAQ
jgi:phosphonate degradation associated HDIG domain protein